MTALSDISVTGMQRGFTLNLISNASMETYEQNTLARFTNLLPNVNELNKSLGTWQVALLEISWPSTIKNVTDGTFETNAAAAAFNDDDDSRNLSNDDFESMDEEEEIKQENLSSQQASPPTVVLQQKQQLLLGAGGAISCDNHSSLLSWSSDDEDDDSDESGEGSIRRDQISAGRYNSVDDLMTELCQKAFNTTTCRWPFSWTVRKENQRLEIHAGDNKEPSAQNNPSLPFIRLVSDDLQNILGVNTLRLQSFNEPGSRFPVEIDAGLHNILVYCDLVQNEVLGDKGTSLLRSITLTHYDDNDKRVSAVSYRSFAKLQWKHVVKSAFQSITVSLRNEMGSLVPFLSRGRTSLTLKFCLQRNSAASF